MSQFKKDDMIVYTPDGDIAKVLSSETFRWVTFNGHYDHEYKNDFAYFSTISGGVEAFRILTPLELAMK